MKAAKEIYQKADAAGSYAGRMAFTVQKIGHLNTYPQNTRALTKDPPKRPQISCDCCCCATGDRLGVGVSPLRMGRKIESIPRTSAI